MKADRRNGRYKIIKQDYVIFRIPRAIVSTDRDIHFCPKCSAELEQYHTLIPVENGLKADVPGVWCRSCDKLYVKDRAGIHELLEDNLSAKDFSLDGEELWDFTNKRRIREKEEKRRRIEKEERKRKKQLLRLRLEKLSAVPSAEVMICVRFADNWYFDYIIASDRKECDSKSILHYSSETARELLSAAYAEQRDGKGALNGKKYSVIKCVYLDVHNRTIPERIVPTCLNIRPDGGLFSSIKNGRQEIVDALLYSLSSNRYEIIRATYEKNTGKCFVDIGLFRNYVWKYGRPNLSPEFEHQYSYGGNSFDDLNVESILMGYGYSVSKRAGLSTKERQELLAEIVDLEILTVARVIRLLDFFVLTHSDDKYLESRYKWEADKAFIQVYKINPQRFLIARF